MSSLSLQLCDVEPWEVDSDLAEGLFSVSSAKSGKGTEKKKERQM